MICPECKQEELTIMGSLTFTIPSKYYRQITKKVIKSKDFKIYGVDWKSCDFICPKCGVIQRKRGSRNDS